jgi:hypothetical protein
MNTTSSPTATDRLAGLLRLQEQQRADFVAELLDAERRAAAGIVDALHPDAGAKLADAIDQIERQIRQDLRAGRLLAKIETSVPSWADRNLPPLDPDDVEAGRRSIVLYVPRAFGDGTREPIALAMIDVSDAVYGRGARKRRDQQAADDQRAEAARGREVERDRQREALRR